MKRAYPLAMSLALIGAGFLPAMAQDTASPDGLVLPGDRIGIRAWTAREMDGPYDVDELGDVILPRLGRVAVGGLTTTQVRDSLQRSYEEFLRGATVEVRVLRRVGVGGEVRLPSLYWVDSTIFLRDAIAMAGGLTPMGNPGRVLLLRSGTRTTIDLEAVSSDLPTALLSGDQIVVPLRSWLSRNTPLVVSTGVSLLTVFTGILLAR
ncbi:MAG: polysaccharide biosynthesis/export family protein [Chloroflexi bacterium]|nr:polysaccharide biosynthesis/export family protein [Chloroflexota bacterium]